MAVTLKALVRKSKMRADKTWNVVIRLIYNRQTRFIPTTEYVTKKELTPSFKIKNQNIVDKCDELIRHYRKKISELNLEINDVGIDELVNYITAKNKSGLSFTDYADKWLKESTSKGKKNYQTAVNALKKFVGRDNILFHEVTVNVMNEFVKSLSDKPRAASLYANAIVKIFNDARDFYNDEDNDVIMIKHSLRKFHAPRQNVAEKRAMPLEVIRRIFALPYDNRIIKGMQSRHDLALDCFRLSFCLMGMNSTDMFSASVLNGSTVVYKRNKTKDRRSDGAEMQVNVPAQIKSLFEKYKDRTGERVFNFYKRFSSPESFNRAINLGLKEVADDLGLNGLQFYSARHSMATIALNDVRIDKYTVNDMLCHTDPAMKVTELYIKKDFAPINEANEKLMNFVFGKNS